ncbi:MAG: hypothetical protein C0412_18125, partial [Flavobacterium sp.]|nr:hypothetical protein [Flavobacterium sp.]
AAHWIICKLRLVDLAITPSVSSRNILLAETKTFPQIEVYYNTAFKSEYSDSSDQPVIEKLEVLKNEKILLGVIARQLPQKRIDIALEILKQLKIIYPNIHFVFCGDGYLLEEMKNYATKIEVNNHSTFLGYVEDIESIMKYLRLILLTSDYEGFPLIIWEAMSCGVPIVSTDVGGIREIVEKESCGLLFEKGNVHEGVQKVIELLSDANLCVQLGQNGRKAIINKYNPLQFGKRIEELYNSLL